MSDFSTYRYEIQTVRSSLVLTTSYVVGNILGFPGSATQDLWRFNQLDLDINFTKGNLTNARIKFEHALELLFNLLYDGQSANFTVGETVTGGTSKAKGVIVADTDAGATGTLVIRLVDKGIHGVGFIDNEPLTDSATGVAVVNGDMSFAESSVADTAWRQEPTLSAPVGGLTAVVLNEYDLPAANTKTILSLPISSSFIRISAKGVGADATNSLLELKARVSHIP